MNERDRGRSFRQDMPCAYLRDGRTASIEYTVIGSDAPDQFNRILSRGYRRFGGVFYRHVCRDCTACVPIRIAPHSFTPDKGQRRARRRNDDLRIRVVSRSLVTGERIRLYRSYITSKHSPPAAELDGDTEDHEETLHHIHYGYPATLEMDYYLGDRLIGVGIIDEAAEALSANYFYYDTNFPVRRLGVYSILREIELARRLGKRYYYLGYYNAETAKMSYKGSFRPHQLLTEGRWRRGILAHAPSVDKPRTRS